MLDLFTFLQQEIYSVQLDQTKTKGIYSAFRGVTGRSLIFLAFTQRERLTNQGFLENGQSYMNGRRP